MLNQLIGQKIKVTQTFSKEGERVPATAVQVGPCVVTQIKEAKDYWSVQLGFSEKKLGRINKPEMGHLQPVLKSLKPSHKQDTQGALYAPRFLREVRLFEKPEVGVGSQVFVNQVFAEGDLVDAIGVSKGKGFAGVVKRYGFAGGPRTHGQSDRERAPGSIGSGTTPGRVFKGKKMAGRMGGRRVTVKNLKVVSIDEEKNQMLLSGLVPSPKRAVLILKKAGRRKKEEENAAS